MPTERISDIIFAPFSRLFYGYQGNRLHDFDKPLKLFMQPSILAAEAIGELWSRICGMMMTLII